MYYNIADLIVSMQTFGIAERQAERYKVSFNGEADIVVKSDVQAWMDFNPELTIDQCEYMSTGSFFYRKLLDFNGCMLHSSCVVVDDRAYLFTADPGTGKSTHTTMWLKQFGDRSFILNDDKPAIRFVDGAWYAYGTPWSGKNDISVNARVPIAGIAILERGVTNEIERFSGVGAIQAILKQVNRPRWPEYRIKLLELMDKLITQVPIWKLKCNMDPEAAIVSYEAMSGQKYEKENKR